MAGSSITKRASARTRRVVALAVATAVMTTGVVCTAMEPAAAITPEETQGFIEEVNFIRGELGMDPLELCPTLQDGAAQHATDMAIVGDPSKMGDFTTQADHRMVESGYSPYVVRSFLITFGHDDVYELLDWWYESYDPDIFKPWFKHVGISSAVGGGGQFLNGPTRYWSVLLGVDGACQYQPYGHVDSVAATPGHARVWGWALDENAGASPADVHVYVDGVGAGSVVADDARSDVASAHPIQGGNHGFDLTVATQPGMRSICTFVINVGRGGNQLFDCRDVWIPDPASPYLDVLSTDTFFDDIVWLGEAGITSGFADGTFKPVAPVTRQAMAAFLWKAAGSPDPTGPAPTFTDVPADHPFRTAIWWMVGEGITGGYAGNVFKPGAPVTRQAMAAFLHRSMT